MVAALLEMPTVTPNRSVVVHHAEMETGIVQSRRIVLVIPEIVGSGINLPVHR
jgi:hypothetical protein